MHITILVLIETLVAFGLSHERPQLPQIPENKETPSGIRLAYLSPSSVSVGWSTYEKIDKPCVSYGQKSQNLTKPGCGPAAKTCCTSRVWFSRQNSLTQNLLRIIIITFMLLKKYMPKNSKVPQLLETNHPLALLCLLILVSTESMVMKLALQTRTYHKMKKS